MSGNFSEIGWVVQTVVDAIPLPLFLVDRDVRILDLNKAASDLIGNGSEPKRFLRKRAGEILRCIHSKESKQGCGASETCSSCMFRNAVNESITAGEPVRRKARMELIDGNETTELFLMVTAAPFPSDGTPLALLILEDINELTEMKDILPICAHCKNIRNESNQWESLESFFLSRLELYFSHGICPQCREKYYSDYRSRF